MMSDPVAAIFEKHWPALDPARIHAAGERFSALSTRLSELQVVLTDVARDCAAGGDGHTAIALAGQARRIVDVEVAAAVDLLDHHARAAHAFGDAVVATQDRLTMVAAIADRDVLAGQVVAAATGDSAALAGAHDGAAQVMAAAAGQLDGRTRDITDHLEHRADTERDQGQGGGGAPMMAPVGGVMAGAMAGVMTQAQTGEHRSEPDVAAADLMMLRSRAAHLAAIQPPEVAPWIRLAVGLGHAGDGRHVVVVGTSEPGGYLRPGTAPEPHEVVVGDGRAPERAIMDYFAAGDIAPLAVCAATPPPPEVAAEVADAGALNLGAQNPGTQNPGPDDGRDQESGQ